MPRVFLIFCFVLGIYSCKPKSVWTPEYERKQFRQIDLSLAQGLPDNTKRRQLVYFLVERLKTELPTGVESISLDSLKRLSSNLGKEYAYAHEGEPSGLTPHKVVWSKEMEDNIRESFLKGTSKEELPMQIKGCNCIIAKLKVIYPDSAIVPFPKDTLSKVAIECRNEMSENSLK